MYPSMCYRCQMFWQCTLACVTGVKDFCNVSQHVLQVTKALAMCLIMCYMCQRLWQFGWLCFRGGKGFGNVPDYALHVPRALAMCLVMC